MAVSYLLDLTRRPSWQLFFVLFAFVIGVFVHSFIESPLPVTELLVVGVGLVVAGVVSRPSRWSLAFLIFPAVAFGLFRYSVSFPIVSSQSISELTGREVRIEGVILNDPRVTKTSQELVLGDLKANHTLAENKLIAWIPQYPELSYGQTVSFRCKIKAPEPIDGFRYDRFLLKQGIVATCFSFDEPLILDEVGGSELKRFVYGLRSGIETGLERVLPEPHSSLAAGLLLGVKKLPEHVEEDFRRTGLSHVVAASGYNVSLVVWILLGGFVFIMRRQRAFWFLMVMIVLYVLLAGAEASVVRAGVMGATALLARHIGRKTTARNIILFSAVLMLLGNPRILLDDVGFQLSILATAGLITLSGPIGNRLQFIPKVFGVREAMSATLAATIFTLPIMFSQFGAVSIVAPLANLFILPLVPYAMAFSGVASVLSLISIDLGRAVGFLAWATEDLMLRFASLFSAIDIATVTIESIWVVSLLSLVFSVVLTAFLLRPVKIQPTKNS